MSSVVRLAVRLALSRDPRQRWRQLSIVLSAVVITVLVAAGIGAVAASKAAEDRLSARMPVAAGADDAKFRVVQGGFALADREVSVRWIEPRPGAEADQWSVPPGLHELPGPGQAVVSPGLAANGISAEALGFRTSTAGDGPQGTIGPAGVGTLDELLVWVRPETGRNLPGLGGGGGYVRFPSSSDLALEAQDDLMVPDYPVPRAPEMVAVVILFILLPGVLLGVLAARARSQVRADRSEFLLRLGVRRIAVRALLATEGALLSAVGAGLGAITAAVVLPQVSAVPLTRTVLAPGELGVAWSDLLVVTGMVVLTFAVASAAGRLEPSRRSRPVRPTSWWRTLPFFGGVAAVIIGGSQGPGWVVVLVGGVVLIAVGLPLAVPTLVASSSRRRRERESGHAWLAAARVAHTPVRSSRVASMMALVVYLGATSVALYTGPAGAQPSGVSSATGPGAAYWVDWSDGRDGDVTRLAEGLAAQAEDVVVVGVTQPSAASAAEAVVGDCTDLEPVEDLLGIVVCASDRSLTPAARAYFEDSFGVDLRAVAPDRRAEPIESVVILSPTAIPPQDVYRAGAGLPRVQPSDLLRHATNWTPTAGWIAVGWAASLVLLTLGVLREMVERSRAVRVDAERLTRAGLDPGDAPRVARSELVLPVLATVPVAYAAGLVTSYFGAGAELTAYAPIWITLYTGVSLALTTVAITVGVVLSGTSRRASVLR